MNSTLKFNMDQLVAASFSGDIHTVKELLLHATPVDVMQTDQDGYTALLQACRNGHTRIVEMLVERVDNKHIEQTWRALMLAGDDGNMGRMWSYRHPHILGMLFPHVDESVVMHVDVRNRTALIYASMIGATKSAEMLLERATYEHMTHADDGGFTALSCASRNGHAKIVAMLLDYITKCGAQLVRSNVMHTRSHGVNAIIDASEWGHVYILKTLLGHVTDEDVMHHATDGSTALIRASISGHSGVVDLLLPRVTFDHVLHEKSGKNAIAFALEQEKRVHEKHGYGGYTNPYSDIAKALTSCKDAKKPRLA